MPSQATLTKNRRIHRRHVQEWQASGLPLNQYARSHDIHPRTFYDWCRKYGGQEKRESLLGESPVVEIVAVPSQNLLTPQTDQKIDIHFGRNFRIAVPPGFSPSHLGRIILTLENLK